MTVPIDDTEKMAIRREADAWVRLLTSGKATVDDARALQCWREQGPVHHAAFEDAKRLWRDFGPAGELLLQQQVQQQQIQQQQVQQQPVQQQPVQQQPAARPRRTHRGMSRRAFLGGMAAAASAAGVAVLAEYPLLGGWTPISEWDADYRTGTGEQRSVRLPGDIVLAMNTQTRVALQRRADRIEGVTLLSGEAAIDAPGAAGGSFRVEAGRGAITAALPARFEVRRDGERTCVTCLEGRITVRVGERSHTLSGHYRIDYDERGPEEIRAIDPSVVSAWRDGVVVFRNTPLPEAVAEINRYRRGRVMLLNHELEGESVSGRFSIQRMDLVIAQIQQAFSARVTTLPGDIVLLS